MTARSLDRAELYGGKIVAALDRQHCRDLFDIKILFEHGGITEEIRTAFVGYLAGHIRPMHELLRPEQKNIEALFRGEFTGMTMVPVSIE